MGVINSAIGDGVLTGMWVFCASTLGALTSAIASALGVQGTATLLITTVLVFLLVFAFGIIGDALGGASFNPTATAAFYAAGLSGDSLISMALRFPAQAVGAVGGAMAIGEVMPVQYKHMLGGPSLKVDLHTGAMAEGFLTFTITFAILLIVLKGPRSPVLKTWLISMATVALVVTGSSYTGPAMNPANAFGWAYINNWHNTWDQLYVYWICPFIGAILAASVFRILFPIPAKQKKA
ncbi:small and basic intrinsic protein 1A [Actinidia rufa]|uniref:Small and basic intrinsic protein 1A n=1 Tax=Actinidia rufa TaxID=165716 RepID=A0A7J0DIU1_9ERIC|nr:small and basic intrinsic protein 1A [Actinidia rufa]